MEGLRSHAVDIRAGAVRDVRRLAGPATFCEALGSVNALLKSSAVPAGMIEVAA